jgi:hypothetical protein
MGPELVRFYGGTPEQWERTPWATARRYFEAIPRVRRREMGEAPVAVARAAAEIPAPAPKRQPSAAELRERLAGMGIGFGAEEKRG